MRNDEFGCRAECDCRDCQRMYRQTSLEDARQLEDCRLAGYTPQIREYARLYEDIAEDRVTLPGADLTYLQVAQIGDAVTNAAERRRLDDASS